MPDLSIEPSRHEIWKMFDAISSTYDKTNHLMTMGLDRYWRRKMASLLPLEATHLLDSATGTGDQLFTLLSKNSRITHATGIDLSEEMVSIARKKLQTHPFQEKVQFEIASALQIPFPDNSFDCVTMSFGIRNVLNVELCLKEIQRVLKPQGRVLILETSIPTLWLVKHLHLFYVRKVLPWIGGMVSKQKQAYRYLNQTAETFPSGKAFCHEMEKAGFCDVKCLPLTFGAVSIYQGDKQ